MGSGHIFLHIRVVLAIVLGLSITKLLNGIALLIERRDLWSPVHVSWVLWALISVVTFWWWEFGLTRVPVWTFSSYLFVIIYGSLYFVLSALLFPDEAEKYGGYEDYLIERRRWFFGLIVLITLMDMIDTSLKGAARWHMLGIAYPIKTGAMVMAPVEHIASACDVAGILSERAARAAQREQVKRAWRSLRQSAEKPRRSRRHGRLFGCLRVLGELT